MGSPQATRLTFITDGHGDVARLCRMLDAVLDAGLLCVQLREPSLGAMALARLCERYRPRLDAVDGLLWVNDRADVAAAGLCHGVWLGHRSLPVPAVRPFLPPGTLVGCSTHDAEELARAAEAGADCVSLAPVFPTRSKPGHAGLGRNATIELVQQARLPVLLLGGIGPESMDALQDLGGAGVMVMSAIAEASDPVAATRRLLARVNLLFS